MAISNSLFSPISENPRGFSAWCVLAKVIANPRNYSYPRPSRYTQNTYNVPRNSCSRSMASNRALKFPLPKEVAPLR